LLLGNPEGAQARLDALLAQAPALGELHALAALTAAASGDAEGAVAALERAAALGFDGLARMLEAPPLAALRDDPRVAALTPAPPPPPTPAVVVDGAVAVAGANTRWSSAEGLLVAHVAFPRASLGPALRAAGGDREPLATWLNRLHARGLAAGNLGDLYDNRDRGHSRLPLRRHPQMAVTAYGAAARAAGVDYGLNTVVRFTAPTIGNSSTAVTGGGLWRSLPRFAMTEPSAMAAAAQLFAANHLYVYPGHRDAGRGADDVFPAAAPYFIVSEGSSGSDRAFLGAAATALAALRPDAKRLMIEKGLIAPTLVMLLRRAAAPDDGDATYLSPAAHPSVLRGGEIDLERLARRAHAIEADAVPPMPLLRVIDRDPAQGGVDVLGDGLSEVLYDTPSAAARIARSPKPRRYLLDASATRDPNGRPLVFHWRLLRGDPSHARLEPSADDPAAAALEVAWREPRPVPGRPNEITHRVDVGVFADNGAEISAPAIFSVALPPAERRVLDAAGRALEIDRAPAETRRAYADPMLFPRADWRDVYDYDADGRLLGWTRWRGEQATRYTRHGLRVETTDAAGRPDLARRVGYPVVHGQRGERRIEERDTADVFRYRYRDAADRLGAPAAAD
jgi:YD repeat-containing protein